MIQTKRLVIKPYDNSDKDDMIELLTNETIRKNYMIPHFKSDKELELMFTKLKELSYCEEHYERGIYINDKLIGFLNDVEIDKDKIEIGYVIHPDYHNMGYATEAFKAVIDDLFKKGFSEVLAAAFINNLASMRVMEKCGMKKIAKSDEVIYENEVRKFIYYSIKK